MNFKRTFKESAMAIIFSAIFFVSAGISPSASIIINAEQNSTITIFNTNDVHGYSGSEYRGGILQNIGCDYIKNVKNSTPNSILVDAGDNTQGTPFATLSKGESSIKMMNAAEYDVATIGNHEFDYGLEQFLLNANAANFPFISANTYYNNNLLTKGCKESTDGDNLIIEKAGKKIGFFGITTTGTAVQANPENIQGVVFKPEIETSREQVKKLKQKGADVIIGIMHVGIESANTSTSHKIAEQIDGLDILIDGHSHSKDLTMVEKENAKPTYVIQTGTQANDLGKIEIKFQNNDYNINMSLLNAEYIQQNYTADEGVKSLYEKLNKENEDILKRILSNSEKTLYAGSYNGLDVCRISETNLGDLVADAMLENGKTIISNTEYANLPLVALENGGGLRNFINSGYISYDEVLSVMAFSNSISVKIITPNVLYEALEHGVSAVRLPESKGKSVSGMDGRFPQISGMRFEFDPARPARNKDLGSEGSRVIAVYLKNQDGTETLLDRADKETQIAFVSNSYEISGGDGYDMLKELKSVSEGADLSSVFQNYIVNKTYDDPDGLLHVPFNANRISMKRDPELFPNFDATITVMEENSALKNTDILVSVDGEEAKPFTTDENAQIVIPNLKSGAHEIYINYNGFYEYGMVSDYQVTDTVNTKELEMILYDRSGDEIASVINIISQIPDQQHITDKDKKFVEFARRSYDSLPEKDQVSIANYERLLNAEKSFESDGWHFINGLWYYKQNKEFLSGWINNIPGWSGQYFYFDPNNGGAMKTGWLQDGGDVWYYCDPEIGIMKTAWINIGDIWYYCGTATGAMKTGWLQDGGTRWFYCNEDGSMYTGWLQVEENWYYLSVYDGVMYSSGNFEIDNAVYKFDENGKWLGVVAAS